MRGQGPAVPRAARGRAARRRLAALPPAARAALALGGLALLMGLAAVVASGGGGLLGPREQPAAVADPVPYDGRSPVAPAGARQRMLVALPRPALGDLPHAREMSARAQRAYERSLADEARALRGALGARGIKLTGVVQFTRVWDGFAATVRTRDLAALTSLGVHPQAVRRLYPATGEPVAVPARPPVPAIEPRRQAPVAVLDTGVDTSVAPLRGRTAPGYDAVDDDKDPAPGTDPRDTRRRETSGTALAAILAAAGERVMPIRVASLRTTPAGAVEAAGTTDELLAGLERAADPDANGDTSDHVPVALVGVSAPYAGFAESPEAGAVRAAAGLGTLVVAPAGEEGSGAGTIGSPGAAPDALTVGALSGPEPAPRVELQAGDERVRDAAVLAGAPPQGSLTLAGPVSAADPAAVGRAAARLVGRVALVRAGANPTAQAAAAAAAGARAVVLADPRDRPLAALPAGAVGVPVVGVTGEGAQALLGAGAGSKVSFGPARLGAPAETPPRMAPASGTGPTVAGLAKPDLAAPGSALTVIPRGGPMAVSGETGGVPAPTSGSSAEASGETAAETAVAGGTAVAATRVAVAAARLARARPRLGPQQLRATLMAAADPRAGLPVARAGAGTLQAPRKRTVTADPPEGRKLRLTATTATTVKLDPEPVGSAQPPKLRLRAGTPRTVRVQAPAAGRLLVRDAAGGVLATVPWLVPPPVQSVPLGALTTTGGHKVDGVRFTLGAFARGDPLTTGTHIQVAERLVLELIKADGTPIETLTSPGGARELMPGQYAYRLPRAKLEALAPGRYAFRARAWAPNQRTPTEARSPAFRR